MYDGLLETVKKIQPAVVITDGATFAGFDLAVAAGVQVIVNEATFLYTLPATVVGNSPDALPTMFSGISIHDMGTALGQRLLLPPIRLYARHVIESTLGSNLNAYRAARGLPPVVWYYELRRKLVLMNVVFGIEYAQPVSPLVHLVGPMIQSTPAVLSDDDRTWLEGSPDPVIFVNMGTIAPLSAKQVMDLAMGLKGFRVLWKLQQADMKHLPADLSVNMRVRPWVSSQLGILQHRNVKLFISHCGINSAQESVLYQVPLLCLPLFADQLDMAQRIVDAGIGYRINKASFDPAEVHRLVSSLLLPSPSRQAALARVSTAIKLAGGARRAADLIEAAVAHGIEHWTPPEAWFTPMVWYNLDLIALYAVLLSVSWLLVKLCCCCCRRSASSSVAKHKNA